MIRILIIDNTPDDINATKKVVEDTLKEMGVRYEITEAKNGREGLMKFREANREERPFNLVITDLKMPEFDGIEVMGIIRNTWKDNTPVVIMTSMEKEDFEVFKKDAVKAGANVVFNKLTVYFEFGTRGKSEKFQNYIRTLVPGETRGGDPGELDLSDQKVHMLVQQRNMRALCGHSHFNPRKGQQSQPI